MYAIVNIDFLKYFSWTCFELLQQNHKKNNFDVQ